MSDDLTDNPDLQPWITPELEARVVARVLGEASPFEAAEIDRQVAEKPELAVFKRRIEAVHGLVREAVRVPAGGWKLSPDRRRKVIEAIGTGAEDVPSLVAVKRARPWYVSQRFILGLAACLVLGLVLSGLLLPAFSSVRSRQIVSRLEPANFEAVAVSESSSFVTSGPAASPQPALPAMPAPEQQAFAMPAAKPIEKSVLQNLSAPGANVAVVTSESAGRDQAPGAGSNRGEQAAKAEGSERESAIRSFTGGWGKGSGSGAGSLARDKSGGKIGGGEAADELKLQAQEPAAPESSTASAAAATGRALRPAASPDGGRGAPALQQERVTGTLPLDEERLAVAGLSEPGPASADAPDAGFHTSYESHLLDRDRSLAIVSSREKSKKSQDNKALALDEAAVSEVRAAVQPFSTFSLHVSDVSFRLAQAALAQGRRPDAESVRAEEFYNAFDYGDPAPGAGEQVGCRIEQAADPFHQQRNLVRIAMKVAATGRGAGQPLRLTVLIDTSGSMERDDRTASVRRAMEVLASLLGPNDAVSVIGFARRPRVLADRLPGDRAGEIVKLVEETPAEGGTNLEEALRLAGEAARNQRDPSAQNRIVLLTDGAANLGNADPARLAGMIGDLRQQGIAFDACGVGAEGLNDEVLEALTRKGDGRYYFLDRPEDADEGFARQLAGAFRPAAANVKVQVRFNPARVGKYRLIGFEKHRLRKEDFRNDLVDAAELAAEEAAVALYQVEVLPDGDGELGEVFVRFRDASSGRMVERSWTMVFESQAPGFDQASPAMQLAGTAAMLAERLRGGAIAGLIDLEALAPVVNGLRGHFAHEEDVAALVVMFGQMRRLESN